MYRKMKSADMHHVSADFSVSILLLYNNGGNHGFLERISVDGTTGFA